MVIPNLCATDMRISSSVSLRPTDAMGDAWSQSPECEAESALSLARSMSILAAQTILSSSRLVHPKPSECVGRLAPEEM